MSQETLGRGEPTRLELRRQIAHPRVVARASSAHTFADQRCGQIGVTDMASADDAVVGALAGERADDPVAVDQTLHGLGSGAAAGLAGFGAVEALQAYQGYGQSWCMGLGGGLLLGVLNGLAIAEFDALDDLAEAVGAIQPTPVALGGLGERRLA